MSNLLVPLDEDLEKFWVAREIRAIKAIHDLSRQFFITINSVFKATFNTHPFDKALKIWLQLKDLMAKENLEIPRMVQLFIKEMQRHCAPEWKQNNITEEAEKAMRWQLLAPKNVSYIHVRMNTFGHEIRFFGICDCMRRVKAKDMTNHIITECPFFEKWRTRASK